MPDPRVVVYNGAYAEAGLVEDVDPYEALSALVHCIYPRFDDDEEMFPFIENMAAVFSSVPNLGFDFAHGCPKTGKRKKVALYQRKGKFVRDLRRRVLEL